MYVIHLMLTVINLERNVVPFGEKLLRCSEVSPNPTTNMGYARVRV